MTQQLDLLLLKIMKSKVCESPVQRFKAIGHVSANNATVTFFWSKTHSMVLYACYHTATMLSSAFTARWIDFEM